MGLLRISEAVSDKSGDKMTKHIFYKSTCVSMNN